MGPLVLLNRAWNRHARDTKTAPEAVSSGSCMSPLLCRRHWGGGKRVAGVPTVGLPWTTAHVAGGREMSLGDKPLSVTHQP